MCRGKDGTNEEAITVQNIQLTRFSHALISIHSKFFMDSFTTLANISANLGFVIRHHAAAVFFTSIQRALQAKVSR